MSGLKAQPDDREARLARALADFVDLEAQGKTVPIDVFCQSHQDLQPELRHELNSMAQIAGADSSDRPERLSGHKILDEIGTGGMGRVYLAMDEGLGRRVAIKTLASRYLSDSKLRARFMQEARAMAKLSHSNIVRIYNLGQSGEVPHFVMEYVDGVPLTQAGQPLTLRQKAELMHKVVVAVEFLHQNQMIHRDLKPGNILVGPDLEPRLLDFGLALDIGDRERLTREGAVVGTPRYFSPEQARADAPLDARSDIFSLGIVLYELLTGTLPFRADTFHEEIRMICKEDPVLPRRLNPSIPGGLQNICLKALEKNPAERYASAREMADDLERYLAGEQPLAAPASHSVFWPAPSSAHPRTRKLASRRDHLRGRIPRA
jgi:serine/threonine-protein kinase